MSLDLHDSAKGLVEIRAQVGRSAFKKYSFGVDYTPAPPYSKKLFSITCEDEDTQRMFGNQFGSGKHTLPRVGI